MSGLLTSPGLFPGKSRELLIQYRIMIMAPAFYEGGAFSVLPIHTLSDIINYCPVYNESVGSR